jgi:hypothetical protein
VRAEKGEKLSRNCGSCQKDGYRRTTQSIGSIYYYSQFQGLPSRVGFATSHARLFWEEIGSVLRLPLYLRGLSAKWHRNPPFPVADPKEVLTYMQVLTM